MNLFRQQALRPYKTALWVMAVVLVVAICGLVTWNVLQGKNYEKKLQQKQEQIEKVQEEIKASDDVIDGLKIQMIRSKNADKAEKERIQAELKKAEDDRARLNDAKNALQKSVDELVDKSNKDEIWKKKQQEIIQAKREEEKQDSIKRAKERSRSIEELINADRKSDPVIK